MPVLDPDMDTLYSGGSFMSSCAIEDDVSLNEAPLAKMLDML
jgi:hypothetical protein